METDVGASCSGAVARLTHRMDMQIGQIGSPQRHQVAVGTQIGLQIGDRLAVAAHRKRQHRCFVGLGRPAQRDGVSVDGSSGVGDWQRLRVIGAGDMQIGAKRQVLTAGGDEVGEHTVIACPAQIHWHAPCSVAIQDRVYMLEAHHVAADQDQVKLLVVVDLILRLRPASGIGDPEAQRHIFAGVDASLR